MPIQTRRGFTLIELVFVVAVGAVLLMVLLPAAHRGRMASGVQGSVDRLRRITWAAQEYHIDHAGQVPLRGAQYSNGQLSGWDTWAFGGKNCGTFWGGGQGSFFDETAYSRPLNPYVYAGSITVPLGYVNTGSGSTWTFFHGHPTPADRASLQIRVFQSPGDRVSYEGSGGFMYGTANPNVSCYDDIGTSYVTNMSWWDETGLPNDFTARFNEGVRRIGLAFDGANPDYVWAGDQMMDLAPDFAQIVGEWGKVGGSVVGFADGRVAYIHLVPLATSGPGYTLLP